MIKIQKYDNEAIKDTLEKELFNSDWKWWNTNELKKRKGMCKVIMYNSNQYAEICLNDGLYDN